ncbi:MAG: zinc ribbon domain-containing protein [Ruminococcaceae bacterium]|jgi:uncharacterized membrane protein|nr:zinc ribbon domain-containing protein [Oscillospiraceae bacterium]
MADINTTPDYTASFDQNDIQQNRVMGVLSYLGILVLIPLFAARESPFARFHCNQGIVLALAEVILSFAVRIFGRLPLVGWIIRLVGGLGGLALFVFAIMGIVNAINGKAKELPLVGGFQILK